MILRYKTLVEDNWLVMHIYVFSPKNILNDTERIIIIINPL